MKNSPLKQNYSKKRGKLAQVIDPAGFFHKSEAPPAIIDPSGETSAFKMKGYPYPGKSPIRQKDGRDWTNTNQGENIDLDDGKTNKGLSERIKNMAGSDFVKDVAVGAVVGMLSKPKKEFKPVRITGGKDQEEENRIA